MTTAESPFLPEHAKDRADDKRPLDSRKGQQGEVVRTRGGDGICGCQYEIQTQYTMARFIFHINVKQVFFYIVNIDHNL